MSTRSADFNYKVALASGLKSLQGGRLRQAEEQFRYLVKHFPSADGGYRGLAKVLVEQEDRPAALRTLVEGGAHLAKAGQRVAAIALYREALSLDSHDLTAHRRLAAALTLAGDEPAAAQEHIRYITSALGSGDGERARLEAAYALERLPESAEIADLARQVGIDVAAFLAARPAPRREPEPVTAEAAPPELTEAEPADDEARAALMRSAFGGAPPPAEPRPAAPRPTTPTATPAGADPWAITTEPASRASAHHATSASDGEPLAADADSSAVEAAAARYLAKRDPRGGEAALEAARRYIADGRTDAASDLLLQLIAGGVADHDAQRLLVDVVRSLGKPDVAKTKCQLLVQALRLDGRDDLAAEVEQLAQAE